MENLHKVGGSNQRLKKAENYLWQGLVDNNLANNFIEILKEIINHCQFSLGGYTPSDFSLAELNQDQIDQILDMVDFDYAVTNIS